MSSPLALEGEGGGFTVDREWPTNVDDSDTVDFIHLLLGSEACLYCSNTGNSWNDLTPISNLKIVLP